MRDRLLAHRRDTYRGDKAPVFPSAAGTELHPSNVASRVLKPATRAAGFGQQDDDGTWTSWVSFHAFRHTCASLLFAAGKNVKQVQEWLGHADPGFTLSTYEHLLDEGLGDADFMDEAVTSDPAQGNAGATRRTETTASREQEATAEMVD